MNSAEGGSGGRPTSGRWITRGCFPLALAAYLCITADGLEKFPPIHEDEAIVGAVAYKLASEGVYGSDLLSGYYGAEHHYFLAPPLHYLLAAGVVRVAGLGLLQLRILPLFLGLFVLVLVGFIGRQLLDGRVSLLALLLLVFDCLSTFRTTQVGIPLLDIARIGRADLLVLTFALTAVLLFNRAERERLHQRAYFLVGSLIGLAALSHLYGAFWLLALLVVLAIRRGRAILTQRPAYAMMGGCALVYVPWWIYVASDLQDWASQATLHSERYRFLEARFYFENVASELHRYDMDLFGPEGVRWARVGAWFAIASVPWVLLRISSEARRRVSFRGTPVFCVAVGLIVNGALYALLLHSKSRFYVPGIWSIAVLLIAWGCVTLWDRHRHAAVRVGLALAIALVFIEGGVRIVERSALARTTTTFGGYVSRLAALVPPGATVLGYQHYWLGLSDHDYRSWFVPLSWSEPEHYRDTMTLDEGIERIRPDVILMDPVIRRLFEEWKDSDHPRHAKLIAYEAFAARHRIRSLGSVDDPTYGRTDVLEVRYDLGLGPLDHRNLEITP